MRKHLSAAAIIALLGLGALPGTTPFASTADAAVAQSSRTPEEERRRARLSLSNSTARVLGEVFNDIQSDPPNYANALNGLNKLLARDNLSKFDRSTALELRGGIYAAQENYAASVRDYVEVLQLDELPFDRLKQIRYNVAQLYFAQENYGQTIRFMRQYLAEEGNVTDYNAWFILAAAYISQDDYRSAVDPAEKALQYDEKKQKKTYDLLNLVYSELDMNEKRGRLLEEMVQRFPNEATYWAQLSGSKDAAGDRRGALATLEAAYNAGLITDEDKIVALAQYYSSLNNPYRGAKLIEKEMAAGTVKRDLDNLVLLSQLWSMAREQDKAIEALSAAARISPSGELYYRLGQSYMASARFEEGIRALNQALERGGLSARDRGDINLLLGNAYFQLDPDSPQGRRRARQAFQRALNSSNSRKAAQGWIGYIDAYEDTLRRQAEVERLQRLERLKRERERCESLVDLADLGGSVNESDVTECRALIASTDESGQPLEPADESPDEEDDDDEEQTGDASDSVTEPEEEEVSEG